jgi:hypothetical protein
LYNSIAKLYSEVEIDEKDCMAYLGVGEGGIAVSMEWVA